MLRWKKNIHVESDRERKKEKERERDTAGCENFGVVNKTTGETAPFPVETRDVL